MYWNAKVGSQEIPGVTGRFGFGVQNEPGQRLTESYQENALVIVNTFPSTTQEKTLHKDTTRWSIPFKLIIFFAAKMEKFYTLS